MRGNKTEAFKAVPHDRDVMLAKAMKNADFAKIWDETDPEISALDTVLKARRKAGITQQQIARRMHTSQAAVARIEKLASGDTKTLPSMTSLKKYAAVLGFRVRIDFDPIK